MEKVLINLWNFVTGFFATCGFASVTNLPGFNRSQVFTSCLIAIVNILGGVLTAIILTFLKKKLERTIKKKRERKFIEKTFK